jgi:hypothetical protein
MSQEQLGVLTPKIARPGEQLMSTELEQLRARAFELRVRVSDLEVRRDQLNEQRRELGADVDKSKINQQLAELQHEITTSHLQIEATNKAIHDLETAREFARVGVTVQPPRDREIDAALERERMVGAGVMLVLLPLVLAFARRLWHRGGPRPAVDLEQSPRLQRMEQAIESIAHEVERIGEAQRFTTKLLTERQPDAAARIPAPPRREPGTITPH